MIDTPTPASTASDTTTTPSPVYVTEAVLLALVEEVIQRLNRAEANIVTLADEIDALKAA